MTMQKRLCRKIHRLQEDYYGETGFNEVYADDIKEPRELASPPRERKANLITANSRMSEKSGV